MNIAEIREKIERLEHAIDMENAAELRRDGKRFGEKDTTFSMHGQRNALLKELGATAKWEDLKNDKEREAYILARFDEQEVIAFLGAAFFSSKERSMSAAAIRRLKQDKSEMLMTINIYEKKLKQAGIDTEQKQVRY